MIIDNKIQHNPHSSVKSVWNYLERYTAGGELNIVTGFFTISALSLLKQFENEPGKFRLVLSEIAGKQEQEEHIIDILHGCSDLTNAFNLKTTAEKAIAFLQQKNVEVRRINNAFCHAKAYVYEDKKDDRNCYFVTGSSNLTEKGLGIWESANVELNLSDTGRGGDYEDILAWFQNIWKNAASDTIDLRDENGKKMKMQVKQYFIDCIEHFCREYTPKEIYYKILYELFKEDVSLTIDGDKRSITRLEDSVIWNTLFPYQQKGVRSLIAMLQKYNGAILADAVGLGKTFSALAVIKYFQSEGYFTLVLCPKKLQANWEQYQMHQGSRFERDSFEYEVRFHTDLQDDRLDHYHRAPLPFLKSRPKMLIVIDESHNLRNDKSSRYQFLINQLLQGRTGDDIKILELSATPINNHIIDVRNQFRIIARNRDDGFNTPELRIPSIVDLFRRAQKVISEWDNQPGDRHIKDLVDSLPQAFFNLTDRMVLARTRAMVERNTGADLRFPKQNLPENIYSTLSAIGQLGTFDEIYLALMAPNLVAYQPSAYMPKPDEKVKVTEDQRQREFFLCRMMLILFLKRLESSWVACKSTVEHVLEQTEHALEKVNLFIKTRQEIELNVEDIIDEEEEEILGFTLGKKHPIRLSLLQNIEQYQKDLELDVQLLKRFTDNMQRFDNDFRLGKVKDIKLEKLREVLTAKVNKSHQKVLIFTTYSDTALYLYQQLSLTFPGKVAMVDGSGATFNGQTQKNFQPALQRFAPRSKLYLEMDWVPLYQKHYPPQDPHYDPARRKWMVSYTEWTGIVKAHHKDDPLARIAYEALQEPVRILIATDCLSEGQNLQDAQTVVNYDIHWNPTRLIQRQGRIDRIGSPNKEIDCINFWPSENYEQYLGLFKRVNDRMAAMAIMGVETMAISEKLMAELQDNPILDRNDAKMLEEVKNTGREQNDANFGLQDLSLESFRQDLLELMQDNASYFSRMPNGIFSGFRTEDDLLSQVPESLVALIRAKDTGELFLLLRPVSPGRDERVKEYNRQEILTILRSKMNLTRYVPRGIDHGDPASIERLHQVLQLWLREKAPQAVQTDIADLLSGAAFAAPVKNRKPIEETFRPENLELLVWEYISKK